MNFEHDQLKQELARFWQLDSVGSLLYFGYLAVDRFLKPVFKEILNNLYVFKAATYAE